MLFQFPIFSIDCKFALCAAVKLCGCDSTHSHSLRYVTTFMGPFFRQFLEFHQPVFFSLLFYIAFFNLGFSVVERGPICWILYCWRYFVSLEFSLLDNYRGFSSHGPSLWNCFLSFFFFRFLLLLTPILSQQICCIATQFSQPVFCVTYFPILAFISTLLLVFSL